MQDGQSGPGYMSYLLRMWRETGAGASSGQEAGSAWRASVVSTLSGKRQGFVNLEELFDFLRQQAGTESEIQQGKSR